MWTTRDMLPSDMNFVAHSYLKSYRHSAPANAIPGPIYYADYKQRLEQLLRTNKVMIVCAESDLDQIVGYVIYGTRRSHNILHYVYVKYPFRHCKIASLAVRTALPQFGTTPTVVTHLPRDWARVSAQFRLLYDPKLSETT